MEHSYYQKEYSSSKMEHSYYQKEYSSWNTHTIKRNTHHQNGTLILSKGILIMEHSYYQKEYSSSKWNTHRNPPYVT